jgi:SAM-dependent methyltransferase
MSTAVCTPLVGDFPVDRVPAPPAYERVPCLSCGAGGATYFIEAEDDLTGRPGRFTFVRCDRCGLVYQQTRLTLEHVKPYYDDGYIAHQRRNRWGWMAPLFAAAVGSLDRAKLRIVARYISLGSDTAVLDVGCGSGSFLQRLRRASGASVAGVDFVDLSDRPEFDGVEFHHGLFYEQEVGRQRFDLVTMWHFLEHDYHPRRSIAHAREALRPSGRLIIEVPRLDSLSFRLFRGRWPGLQAPQHTALYDRARLIEMVTREGLEVVDYLPYGAFPPYFYLFCGVAFHARPGRGLNLSQAIYAYFAGELILLPVLPLLKYVNFAMQTVVCRKHG